MRLARSVATANGTGVIVFSTVQSYGDNDINGNGTDVSGTRTSVATKALRAEILGIDSPAPIKRFRRPVQIASL